MVLVVLHHEVIFHVNSPSTYPIIWVSDVSKPIWKLHLQALFSPHVVILDYEPIGLDYFGCSQSNYSSWVWFLVGLNAFDAIYSDHSFSHGMMPIGSYLFLQQLGVGQFMTSPMHPTNQTLSRTCWIISMISSSCTNLTPILITTHWWVPFC